MNSPTNSSAHLKSKITNQKSRDARTKIIRRNKWLESRPSNLTLSGLRSEINVRPLGGGAILPP